MGKDLGLKIKQLRSEYSLKNGKKFTQADLAKTLGISRSYLGDIESGRTNPSDEILNKIAEVFSVNLDDLLDYKFKELDENFSSNQLKEEVALYETGEFKSAESAIKFILKQPAIMGFGGFDINKMNEDEVVDFANELLRQLKLISYKYKR